MNKILKIYKNYCINFINNKFNNIMKVPKIKKITLNMGLGKSILNKKCLQDAILNLSLIACQKPILCKAKKSISSFKLKKGWPIGCKVTLRNNNMYNFLERLLFIAIPRIRDFNGFNYKIFDKNGNFSIGIKDQTIFPEINYNQYNNFYGMNICFTMKSNSQKDSIKLLKLLNFPFHKL